MAHSSRTSARNRHGEYEESLGRRWSTVDGGQLFGWSREAHMFVATALARAAKDEANSALADSAGALLVANRGNLEVDPDRALLTMEAFVRTLLEDYDEAIDLLRRYYTNNPHHRAEETRDVHWWWRSIQDDPRYRALRRPAG